MGSVGFDTLIPFVLVLAPGAIVQYFYRWLSPVGNGTESDLRWAFLSLLYGWPVLLVNWLAIRFIFDVDSNLRSMETLFYSFSFYFCYGLLSFLVAFVVAVVLVKSWPFRQGLLRSISRRLMQPEIAADTPWGGMFNSKDAKFVEVRLSDGRSIKGAIEHVSLQGNEPQELILTDFDLVQNYGNYIQEVTRVYVNCDSGITITQFDMTPYLDFLQRRKGRERTEEASGEAPT